MRCYRPMLGFASLRPDPLHDELEVAGSLEKLGEIVGQEVRVAVGRVERRMALEQREALAVVQIRAKANAGKAVVVQRAGDRLRDDPGLRPHLTDVKVRHSVLGQEFRVTSLELRAHVDVVEVDELAVGDDHRLRERIPHPPLPGDPTRQPQVGNAAATVQLRELDEQRGVRAQVGEHFVEAGQSLGRAVERSVVPCRIVEPVLPPVQVTRGEVEGRGRVADPPDRVVGNQPAAPANARAAGMT